MCLPQSLFTLLSETGFITELINLVRLAGQRASGDPLVSPAFPPAPALGLQCPAAV